MKGALVSVTVTVKQMARPTRPEDHGVHGAELAPVATAKVGRAVAYMA
jgi:hypothetical protein